MSVGCPLSFARPEMYSTRIRASRKKRVPIRVIGIDSLAGGDVALVREDFVEIIKAAPDVAHVPDESSLVGQGAGQSAVFLRPDSSIPPPWFPDPTGNHYKEC